MSLKEIHLKEAYDSDIDDILREFYIPVLSQSISYQRISGFFSSSTLAITAKGILNFIKNNGKMKLICSSKFSESDINIITDVVNDSNNILSNNFQNELSNLDEGFIKDHLKAFGWMLANNLIEIKIAIPLNDYGLPLDSISIENTSLFHQKVGILKDENGYLISFSGSQNETLFGWYYNIEEFKVFKSWIVGDEGKLEADIKKFRKYWNGETKRTIIIDLPEAIERNLLEIAPKSIEELKLDKWINKKLDNKIKVNLRNYQLKAIENWKNNNYKGIFEMATGTGKTFAALGCLNDITKIESKLVTIIACPNNHLITQWKREIDKFGFDCDMIIADSTKRKWKDVLADKVIDINIDNINNLIILTTHTTLTSCDFKSIFEKSNVSNFLIVDEVHGIGSPKRRENLLNNFKYKLGLSATPERWFDEEGTEFINNYFSGIVYKFPLSKAISRFLSEYEYHPYFINLTEQELEEYELKTKKLAKAYFASKNKQEKEEWYQLICFTRQNIVKNAEKKFEI
ncbi:MAG: DEAD/DEAH box helicase family protein, partial [Promethearchaeota archaeon]